jgi:hypothetical protein
VCVKPANHLCVYSNGTPPCPASFPHRTVAYGGINSTYTCTACQCGMPTAPTCMPTTTFYQDTFCKMSLGTVVHDGTTCAMDGSSAYFVQITNLGTPSGGSCSSMGGGNLVGSASGINPFTFCCST